MRNKAPFLFLKRESDPRTRSLSPLLYLLAIQSLLLVPSRHYDRHIHSFFEQKAHGRC